MRVIAMVVATVMAVITLVFHIIYGSSLWYMVGRVLLTWCGFVILVYVVDYGFKLVFGYEESPRIPTPIPGRRLDLTSRPDDDEFFR
ncbi:MAG: hypothetical protein FWF06_04795 [Symbiobacteriaceae bacterium]|nr:hypothetical protein [Symbiobacteriaceae bacterium]